MYPIEMERLSKIQFIIKVSPRKELTRMGKLSSTMLKSSRKVNTKYCRYFCFNKTQHKEKVLRYLRGLPS